MSHPPCSLLRRASPSPRASACPSPRLGIAARGSAFLDGCGAASLCPASRGYGMRYPCCASAREEWRAGRGGSRLQKCAVVKRRDRREPPRPVIVLAPAPRREVFHSRLRIAGGVRSRPIRQARSGSCSRGLSRRGLPRRRVTDFGSHSHAGDGPVVSLRPRRLLIRETPTLHAQSPRSSHRFEQGTDCSPRGTMQPV